MGIYARDNPAEGFSALWERGHERRIWFCCVARRRPRDWRGKGDRAEDRRAPCVVHQLLNAADYGVPQRRERVVFVGFRSE
ncbi:MAG: DNA cytosine methyltransferase [Methylocella sp.]